MNQQTRSGLGEVVQATWVVTKGYSPKQVRRIIYLLAGCVALMMTGFGIILPIFARRLSEFGAGVEALSLMIMSFALAQFISAPIMGSLADRYGRRPLILLGLIAYAIANVGFLLASTTTAFVLVRALEGALTAGLFPAALGVVADIAPEKERAQWAGILMGSYGAGFIFGPVIGGFLYDAWGFAMPFIASAVMAILAFIAAFILVPETHTPIIRWREKLLQRRTAVTTNSKTPIWRTLPRPLYIFVMLLLIDFVIVFAFAFVEPEMVFYFYDDLGWSTIQFGVLIGIYGSAMVLGQWLLGPMSDRFARKPVIIIGLLINGVFYLGLTFLTSFIAMLGVSILAGIGEALVMPALSAYYLDISDDRYRSRVLGFKESSASLGGVVGPLAVAAVSALLTSQGIFLIGFLAMAITAGLALVVLREPKHKYEQTDDLAQNLSRQRSMAAQTVYSGIVLNASTARRSRTGG